MSLEEILSYGPPNSESFDPVPELASRSVVASQAQCIPSLQHAYVPGNCAKRLTEYMHAQQQISNGSSIEFSTKVVTEFFAPHAKKRWCFSLCENRPKKTGPFPQRMWHCQICKRKPGCGYEATVELLPRLFEVSYDSGILQEIMYVDMPREYQKMSGEISLEYEKATIEIVYQNLRIVRDGHLCIVFTPDLKIRSWDFCVRTNEQFIPGRTLLPQVKEFQFLTWKYNLTAQNASSNLRSEELKKCSDRLVKAACGFSNALNLPSVTDVGYTIKYLRSLEISEVVNCMGDLIDHSLEMGMGPRMSLAILGGSSSQNGVPNSDRKRKRPMVQEANDHNLAPGTYVNRFTSSGDYNRTNYRGSTYACSSSQVPSSKSSAPAPIARVDISPPVVSSAPSSSFNDSESRSSH